MNPSVNAPARLHHPVTPVTPVTPLRDPAEMTRAERGRLTEELLDQLRACEDPERDRQLRDELIAVTMPVAAAIAQRYRSRGVAQDDLEQVAYLALTKAVHRYDADSGHPLLVFCVPTIRGEIRRYFRDHGWAVRPPRRVQELQAAVHRAEAELTASLGRTPSAQEIAESLGEAIDDVLEAQTGQGCFTPASLDRPVGGDRDDVTLGDLLTDEHDDRSAAEARVVLGPAVRQLGDRDRRILEMRFIDGLTQREIATEIGVTQMQVSRLLTRIFRDLRETIGDQEEPDEEQTAAQAAPVAPAAQAVSVA